MSHSALVTGAAGFVGRILCAYLEEHAWRVVRCGYPPVEGVLSCDVTDRAQIAQVLDQAEKLTHVFHLGAITFVPDSGLDPVGTMAVNLNGTIELLSALQERGFQGRFLFVSTAEIYGPPQTLPVTETHPLNPQNPYAISKAAADHYCAWFDKSSSIDIIRMRPFNHSGPGQSDQFVLSSFARQIVEAERGVGDGVMRVGNLSAARDFLHVQDVVRAYEMAALQAEPGQAYNISSGQAQVIQEALDRLLAQSAASLRIETDPARMRPVEVPSVCGSSDKLHQATGWEAQIPFETLLSDLLAYWRTALD